MSLLQPPLSLLLNNNAPPTGSPFVPESSLRSNLAFVGVVFVAVLLYKGARFWAWLGDRVRERRSRVLAQELLQEDDRKDAAGANGRANLPDGSDWPAGGDAQVINGLSVAGREAGAPHRRRRKSRASELNAARQGAASPALSRPTPLVGPPPSSSASSSAASSSAAAASTSREPVNAIAGPSSPQGASPAGAPREMGDHAIADPPPILTAAGAPSRSSQASAATKGKGRDRSSVELDSAEQTPIAPPQSTLPLSKRAKKAALAAKAKANAVAASSTTDPSVQLRDVSPLMRQSRTLQASPAGSSSSRKELSPPSSVSSLAMSSASSLAGASSDGTTLASSTLSLGLDFSPLTSVSGGEDMPLAFTASGPSADKALRLELAATAKRLHATQGVLDAAHAELEATRARLRAAEADLADAEASSAAARSELDAVREGHAAEGARVRTEVDGLRTELKAKELDLRRAVDERGRRDRDKLAMKRELDRWKEDGRKWELMEREFKLRDADLLHRLHHTTAACYQQLHQIRTLEAVLRQYNHAFAPAAAVASAALNGQIVPTPPPPPLPSVVVPPSPSLHAHSLSPAPSPGAAHVRLRRMSGLSSTSNGNGTGTGVEHGQQGGPFVVLPSTHEMPYPTLPDPGSTSEGDVSHDVVMSVLKNPGGLGVGGGPVGASRGGDSSSDDSSRRSRNGSVDSASASGLCSASSGSSTSTRPEDNDSVGSPTVPAADEGTPELVFASIPSYDALSRPLSSTAGGGHSAVSDAGVTPQEVVVESPVEQQQEETKSPSQTSSGLGSPTTPMVSSHPPLDAATPRASGLPSAAAKASP